MSIHKQIKQLQKSLATLIGDWAPDGSTPPNWVRKNGLGLVVAEVHRWQGGFGNPHQPIFIGWKAEMQTSVFLHGVGGILPTHGDAENTIAHAKGLADKALVAASEAAAKAEKDNGGEP